METSFRVTKLPQIKTDADMIEQIIGNIIGNAIKYGSSGKYLFIVTEQQATSVRIIIGDKGPGIAKKERSRIFKPFYRIDNSLSEGVSGTGIGLSIAKTLAFETGSTLKLENTETGAVFSLTIPFKGDNS